MISFDTHIHTEYSTDSNTKVVEQINRAENTGLKGLCITDHMDYDFPENALEHPVDGTPFQFDVDTYIEHLQQLKGKSHITLLTGVECGLQTGSSVISKNKKLVSDYDWDYIIGSLHLVNAKDPYYPSFWENKEPTQCITEYFQTVLTNIQRFSEFDSLGHLDYIVRYAPATYSYVPADFREILEEILTFIIRKDIALEVNTSGWKTSGRCQNPHFDILKIYTALGGELITIGSDAHTPEYISYRFSDLPDMLKSIGLRQYCVFQKRKPMFFDLL